MRERTRSYHVQPARAARESRDLGSPVRYRRGRPAVFGRTAPEYVTAPPVTKSARHDDGVAENEPTDEPPTPPTGLPALPAVPAPPALPPGLNADEYRRFQEFQRFQDYQRFVQTQGQPAGVPDPAPGQEVAEQLAGVRQHLAELSASHAQINRTLNPPLWKKILGSRWLYRLVWLAVIVIIGVWGIPALVQHFLGGAGSGSNPNQSLPKELNGTLIDDPKREVVGIYKFVATDDPVNACHVFSITAANQFASAYGVQTCEKAIDVLSKQVKDKASYQRPYLDPLPEPPGGLMTISSCSFPVVGGPRLGTFTMTQQNAGWEITGYAAQQSCPAPTSSAPPT